MILILTVKGSKAEKEKEVERLMKELMAVRSEFSRVKSLMEKRESDYSEQTNELKIAEDEIDELKKLLNVAKDIRRKSVGFLTEDQKKKQEEDTPDRCKQQ